jgi:hypothetical protein
MATKKEDIATSSFSIYTIYSKKNMKKKLFFGWENTKWVIREIGKIYSSKSSVFSKKRIESGIAFIVAQWGMIFFLLEKHSTLTMTDLIMWAGVEFAISGYIIHQIQKEKKTEEQKEETPE